MKVTKGLLSTSALLIAFYLLLFKPMFLVCLALGLIAYAAFSYWIFQNLSGRYIPFFKFLLCISIMFIFIGGFYFQWEVAAMYTGKLLAFVMILFPVIVLFFAYHER